MKKLIIALLLLISLLPVSLKAVAFINLGNIINQDLYNTQVLNDPAARVRGARAEALRIEQESDLKIAHSAIAKISSYSSIKKFFLGPDYPNIKIVKEVIIRINNRSNELREMKDQAQDSREKQYLSIMAVSIDLSRSKLEQDLKPYEGGFSLFGWLR